MAGLTAPAQAAVITYSVGAYGMSYIGSIDPSLCPFDNLYLSPVQKTIELAPNSPVLVDLNGLRFSVGFTGLCTDGVTPLYAAARTINVNGRAATLTQPFDVLIGPASDTLEVYDGPTSVFDLGGLGRLRITPIGLLIDGMWGDHDSAVQGLFLLADTAPEPGAAVLIALGSLLLLQRRFLRRSATARPA